MTSQLLRAPQESLLGHSATGLRLRLADHTGASRVVDVSGAKCTIGTAATCTVRLAGKSPGRRFDPIECFILQGHAHTVVRRLAPGVRLNGREFTDAVLQTGDRLAIGVYEIEVLPPADRGVEPLDELDKSESFLAAERAAWQADRDNLHAELDGARAEIKRLVAEGETHLLRHHQMQEALARLQDEWQAEKETQAIELDRRSGDLAAAIDQLSNLSLAFAEANSQVRQLTADIDHQSELTCQSQTALDQLREELAQARAASQERQDGEQSRQTAADEFSREVAELRDELETTRELLSRERATWEDERRLHQLDHDAVEAEGKSRCAILKQRLADLTHELDAARQRLVEEREQWQQSLADQRLESEQRLAELLTEAAATVIEPSAAPEQAALPTERQAVSNEEAATSDGSADFPHAEREGYCGVANEEAATPDDSAGFPHAEREGYCGVSNEEAAASEAEPAVADSSERPKAIAAGDAPTRSEANDEAVALQAPSLAAPATTADLLSRFGLSPGYDDSEPPAAGSATEPSEGARQTNGDATPHRDEDDSIDSYMAQLMARLGRAPYSPPRVDEPQATTVAPTRPDPEPVAPVDAPAEPKLRDPSEMGRRAPAPERAADLSAMREIANLNARAAIDTHARGNLVKTWLSKAAVMVLGLGAAGAEAWFAVEGNDTASYFIVPCFMVALFWGWQYLAMSKRLNQSRDEVVGEKDQVDTEETTNQE
ncbi:MAG TPA: hypothetical protein VF278_02705 [Pirellulales bacterium]